MSWAKSVTPNICLISFSILSCFPSPWRPTRRRSHPRRLGEPELSAQPLTGSAFWGAGTYHEDFKAKRRNAWQCSREGLGYSGPFETAPLDCTRPSPHSSPKRKRADFLQTRISLLVQFSPSWVTLPPPQRFPQGAVLSLFPGGLGWGGGWCPKQHPNVSSDAAFRSINMQHRLLELSSFIIRIKAFLQFPGKIDLRKAAPG